MRSASCQSSSPRASSLPVDNCIFGSTIEQYRDMDEFLFTPNCVDCLLPMVVHGNGKEATWTCSSCWCVGISLGEE
jgi:hypothetical protein